MKEIAELVKSDYRKENGLQEQLEGWEHQYLMCTQIRMDVFFSVKVVWWRANEVGRKWIVKSSW